ncbi:MAG: ATP-binding protein [Daejeonella sp.]|uniref:ATP-binding protein n=1 Tax=Daejeonella sp. TaxID=2805397 RepID=UPI003C786151
MKPTLSLFNWSLTKVLDSEPDNLNKARISIIFAIIIFTLLKCAVALPAGWVHNQDLQVTRVIIFLVLFIFLLKILLIDKRYAHKVGLVMIWAGLSLSWTNVFLTAQSINIITIQVVVTVILSSFYLLNWRGAMLYSFVSVLPIIVLMAFSEGIYLSNIKPVELASPAYEIIVILNFLTIVVAHFLYYQALNKNVVEKELLNKQLQQAVRDANQAVQSKADFLSTMSHELRTPLNSVIGMTQLLMNSPYNEEQLDNLKIVNFSAMNLHMLIKDILDFNKLESDKLSLETININLYALVNDICSGMRFQAEDKGLDLVVNIDDSIKAHQVFSDPTRLTQVIHNLLANAIKFTHIGSVTLSLSVIESNSDSIKVQFSVADSGIGIEKQQQQLIFDAFTQASSSTTRKFGGTGLGLTIVKRLLKLFNSDIILKSNVGEGSEFFFEITFLTAGEINEALLLDRKVEYDLGNLKVLVVEDNPINSLLIKKIFSNWNSEPEFASNGYEAIDKVEACYFDVILMDIHMPLLDGYATSKLIRNMPDKSKSCVPILALTASVSSDLCVKIRDAGMNDYINKPFNSDDLYRKLKSIKIKHPQLLA